MAEYIDRQKLLEKAKSHLNSPFGAALIIAEIENALTADVVEIELLKDWLWEIALNNAGGDFSIACQDIISRLGGLRSFSKERAVNYESSKTEKR